MRRNWLIPAALAVALVSLASGLGGTFIRTEGHGATYEWELRALAIVTGLPGYAALHLASLDFFTLSGQLAAATISFLTWWTVLLRLRERRRMRRTVQPAAAMDRRQFLQGSLAVGAAALSLGAYGTAIENRALEVTRLPFAIQDLPRELEGLRIAFMADLHAGPFTPNDYLAEVARQVNAMQPDLVLIPGDFVDKHGRYFDDAARMLSTLRPTLGTFGTLGNHDHWEGTALAHRKLTEAGVTLIDNDRVFLTRDRRVTKQPQADALALAGVGDLWVDKPDLARALRDVPASMPRLLLSHNPDFAEEAPDKTARVDLMLSGHTHGGQMRVPLLGTPFLPSRYGQKYASGLVQGPAWPVYVTRGIGVAGSPVRLGVRPELTLLTLARA